MKKILVVEDEPKIREGIVDALRMNQYEVLEVERGDDALAQAIIQQPDLIILDVMLPKLNGFDVCENLRESGMNAPIIMVSAKGGEGDRVKGLNKGADDYVTKPFSIKELILRVKTHLRRSGQAAPQKTVSGKVRIKSLTLDFDARAAWLDDKRLNLSEKEFLILQFLIDRVGSVVQREVLLKEVWNYSDDVPETRTVDVTIGKLRQKIEKDPSRPEIVQTRHGRGYIIESI